MIALKVLTATYFIGAAVFCCALVIIALRFFEFDGAPDPKWPLFIGFGLMIGSKLLARPLYSGNKTNG